LEGNDTSYECVERSGKGSFGVVFRAKDTTTLNDVAIKRVLQDPRYKVSRLFLLVSHSQNRELQIMKALNHPNCVQLLDSFYDRKVSILFSHSEAYFQGNELYLNLVLAYIPKNLFEVCTVYIKKKIPMPLQHVKVWNRSFESQFCLFLFTSSILIKFVARSLTYTRLAFATEISNRRIC
jgi:serine/threonine protein kinase